MCYEEGIYLNYLAMASQHKVSSRITSCLQAAFHQSGTDTTDHSTGYGHDGHRA